MTQQRLRLPDGPQAPSVARRSVRSSCPDWPGGLVEDALLLTSELVTNAVRHGRPPVELVVDLVDEVLRVEVTDSGPGPGSVGAAEVAAGPHPLWAENGRGLVITAALADRWGARRAPAGHGAVVWFEMDVPAGPD